MEKTIHWKYYSFHLRAKGSTNQAENHQTELEKLKDDLNGQLSRLRVDYAEKVEDLERRLEVALGAKLEHMMALREEVEKIKYQQPNPFCQGYELELHFVQSPSHFALHADRYPFQTKVGLERSRLSRNKN